MTRRGGNARAGETRPAERESRIRRGTGRRITSARNRRLSGRAAGARAVVLVFPSIDGTWSVSGKTPREETLSHFPTEIGAMRHAIRLARGARPSEIRILDRDGAVAGKRELR